MVKFPRIRFGEVYVFTCSLVAARAILPAEPDASWWWGLTVVAFPFSFPAGMLQLYLGLAIGIGPGPVPVVTRILNFLIWIVLIWMQMLYFRFLLTQWRRRVDHP